MNYFSIYPHYGFINTNFTIRLKKEPTPDTYLKIMPEERILHIPPKSGYIETKIAPGEHELLLLDTSNKVLQNENIFVDDAYKIGGSIVSGEFVCPNWIVLSMKDRSYFYNRYSKEEIMEYNIFPTDVKQITPNVLLFKENHYLNFFSMDSISSLVRFSTYDSIYYDESIIIYKSDKGKFTIVNDFINSYQISYDQYSFHQDEKKLFTYINDENRLYVYDINKKEYYEYKTHSLANLIFQGFTNVHFAIFKDSKNNYYVLNLDNGKELYLLPINRITNYFSKEELFDIRISQYINSSNNIETYIRINNKLELYIIKENLLIIEYQNEHYIINDLYNFKPIPLNKSKIIFQNNNYIVFSNKSYEEPKFIIYNINNKEMRTCKNARDYGFRNEFIYAKYDNKSKQTTEVYNLKGELLTSGDIYIGQDFYQLGVLKVDNQSYYLNNEHLNRIDFGYHVSQNTIHKDGGYYYYEDGELRPLPYKIGYYVGNKDCLLYEENKQWNLLEWNNESGLYQHSIIFQKFDHSYYKSAQFFEDGSKLLCQSLNNTYCIYNIEDNSITPFYIDTCVQRSFNANQLLISDFKNSRVVFKDPISLEIITPELLNQYAFYSLDRRYCISYEKANPIIKKEDCSCINEKGKRVRTQRRYFEVTDNKRDIPIKIYTSNWISYINYVSFSYDSIYVAIVGATNNRGFIMIYDLASEKVVFEYPSKNESDFVSGAIWISSFNKDGKLAIYNSAPYTYIFNPDDNYKSFEKIENRNFLCYSPTGNYMALSTQGYNAWAYGTNSNWGHEKSTKLYIRKTNELNTEIGPLEIFGNAIIPRTTRDNIGSVAFSLDEKKLLVKLDDGTLIIKKLNL